MIDPKDRETAVVVGVITKNVTIKKAKTHLDELARLADTAGAEVIEYIIQKRDRFNSTSLLGSGKLLEVAEYVKTHDVDLVIFDEDLTGSQVKKIESIVPCKVIDRSGLILDIFARNAQTAESKRQVEVAQLEYILPRLTRAWTHLCRQVGGIGTRGPGETQLEVDRRLIRKRITELKKRLKKSASIKQRQHDRRHTSFHAALVGYTNVGKSSLMNLLTHSQIKTEDRLFVTLDATTRKLNLGLHSNAVLSDTVGFIRKLPHKLIESFKSTLGVVSESSIILHIIDIHEQDFADQMEVTAKVLSELDTSDIPRITIFNKIDLIERERLAMMKSKFPDALFISVHKKHGIETLNKRIEKFYSNHVKKHISASAKPATKGW
ncbi:MAG: GTPase HflX [Fibrobacteria bacterium]|nr:GTPase HflX [Fibrobacteria bacterium]